MNASLPELPPHGSPADLLCMNVRGTGSGACPCQRLLDLQGGVNQISPGRD